MAKKDTRLTLCLLSLVVDVLSFRHLPGVDLVLLKTAFCVYNDFFLSTVVKAKHMATVTWFLSLMLRNLPVLNSHYVDTSTGLKKLEH